MVVYFVSRLCASVPRSVRVLNGRLLANDRVLTNERTNKHNGSQYLLAVGKILYITGLHSYQGTPPPHKKCG